MKQYEAPMLYVDTFAPDTMIASGGPAENGLTVACWGCDIVPGKLEDGSHYCLGSGAPGC